MSFFLFIKKIVLWLLVGRKVGFYFVRCSKKEFFFRELGMVVKILVTFFFICNFIEWSLFYLAWFGE